MFSVLMIIGTTVPQSHLPLTLTSRIPYLSRYNTYNLHYNHTYLTNYSIIFTHILTHKMETESLLDDDNIVREIPLPQLSRLELFLETSSVNSVLA